MREAELDDLKKEVEDVGGSVSSALNNDFKPIDPIKDEPRSRAADRCGAEGGRGQARAICRAGAAAAGRDRAAAERPARRRSSRSAARPAVEAAPVEAGRQPARRAVEAAAASRRLEPAATGQARRKRKAAAKSPGEETSA